MAHSRHRDLGEMGISRFCTGKLTKISGFIDHRKARSRVRWHVPLLPALRRQRQVTLSDLEACLFCRVSSRPAKVHSEKRMSMKYLSALELQD